MGSIRADSNYNITKLARYPRPGRAKLSIDMLEVKYVGAPYKLAQTIAVAYKRWPVAPYIAAETRATMDYFADPAREPILWYTQAPYHSVIVFRNVKYALIACEYIKKPIDIRHGKTIYGIDRRFLTLHRMVDLPEVADKWIDQKITEALGTRAI